MLEERAQGVGAGSTAVCHILGPNVDLPTGCQLQLRKKFLSSTAFAHVYNALLIGPIKSIYRNYNAYSRRSPKVEHARAKPCVLGQLHKLTLQLGSNTATGNWERPIDQRRSFSVQSALLYPVNTESGHIWA